MNLGLVRRKDILGPAGASCGASSARQLPCAGAVRGGRPWRPGPDAHLGISEMALSDRRRVLLQDRPSLLMSFQHDFWGKLCEGRNVALEA